MGTYRVIVFGVLHREACNERPEHSVAVKLMGERRRTRKKGQAIVGEARNGGGCRDRQRRGLWHNQRRRGRRCRGVRQSGNRFVLGLHLGSSAGTGGAARLGLAGTRGCHGVALEPDVRLADPADILLALQHGNVGARGCLATRGLSLGGILPLRLLLAVLAFDVLSLVMPRLLLLLRQEVPALAGDSTDVLLALLDVRWNPAGLEKP